MTHGYSSRPASIKHNADTLVELASYLETSGPDNERATDAKAPRSHREVGDEVVKFTGLARDFYHDAVTLLISLAGKLHATGETHREVDGQNQQIMNRLMLETTLVPPEQR